MAYQTRMRDPLLETHMQEAIRKRGTELIGIGLIFFAALMASILYSYSPEDPGWFTAPVEPAKNALGGFGAGIANPLILTIGWAAWCIPLSALTWGIRLAFHIGQNRVLSRVVFIPIAVAFSAIFLATHVPSTSWQHGFGLGGLFGDAALGVMIDLSPLGLGASLFLATLILAAITVSLGLFVLGFSRPELRLITHSALLAVIISYDSLIRFFTWMPKPQSLPNPLAKMQQAMAERKAEETYYEKLNSAPQQAHATPVQRHAEPEFRVDTATAAREPMAPLDITSEDFEPEPTANRQSRLRSKIDAALMTRRAKTAAASLRDVDLEPLVTENIFRDTDDVIEAPLPKLGGAQRSFDDPKPVEEFDFGNNIARDTETVLAAISDTPKSVVQHDTPKTVKPSTQAKKEAQPSLFVEPKASEFETPPLSLLSNPTSIVRHHLSDEALEENARMLENVLDDYGVKGEIVSVRPGPVVTMYELEPAPGLKASRVIGLADDIARSMSALSARVSTVPGRTVIGIELPNVNRENVLLREILSARDYGDGQDELPLALGKDIAGVPVVANLAKMPHLLIAGTTGSGKSVAINTMILSLLYKLRPDECRMIMIDPKMLELSVYDGIPHLLSPVVTDPKKAVVALKWVVVEMEERYRKMSKMGVRNIAGYNAKVSDALAAGENFVRTVQTGFADETGEPVFETETFMPEKMPFIVVVVDEMADLMMVAGKEIEACIQRLAQMARASGIHLIMATQRPSVDVITGTIKANFPTRISFQVTSKIDSRTIIGEMGAEQLLGMGDMLYMAGGGKITRVHGPFVSDEEVEEIVNHLKAYGPPVYVNGVVDGPSDDKGSEIDQVLGLGGNTTGEDALYDQAVAIVIRDRKCSTSYIQRKLSIGYNKAARLVEQMEDERVVSQANHVGKREILVPEQ